MTTSTEAVTAATPRRPRSVLRRAVTALLLVLVVAVVLVPVLATGFVVVTARAEGRAPTDVVVVLGAAQFDGRPSPVLEARLAHAETLYSDGVAPQVVTVGSNQPGDRTTEAAVGQDWLVSRGVPAQDVTSVPVGHDTLSSLTAVAHLMSLRGWTSATIVTDPAHEARSIAMARALGIDAHGSPTRSGSGSSLTFEYVVRETGGLLYFWLVERRGIEQVVDT